MPKYGFFVELKTGGKVDKKKSDSFAIASTYKVKDNFV
jgi:hypothetical protein